MEFGRRPSNFAVFDREIPVRSAIDFDYANFQLTTARDSVSSSSSPALPPSRWGPYREILGKVLFDNRTNILSFNNIHIRSFQKQQEDDVAAIKRPKRLNLYSPDDVLDAPGLADDENLNLLDWGTGNCIALAIGNIVYLWIGPTVQDTVVLGSRNDVASVTSVSWAPDGLRMAIGLNNSEVQLWDLTCSKLLVTLRGVHRRGSQVGSLAWNSRNILTTGGADGRIVDTDPRLNYSDSVVHTYRGGHSREICGLKWSSDSGGRQLASGGSDGLVHIWDSRNQNRWKFRFTNHAGAVGTVRALAWCPFRDHLLATGGGEGSVKFWSTHTGTCINSLQTGISQVCALLWSKNKQQLLTSCSGNQDQLTLWDYPSMVKTGQLVGHSSRALYLAQSPDGCSVASASGGANDETLKLWNIFLPVAAKKAARGPFGGSNRTQIRFRAGC